LNLREYQDSVAAPQAAFRVTDLRIVPGAKSEDVLIVAHHYWHKAENCVTFRVSEAQVDLTNDARSDTEWHTLFESIPCVAGKIKPGTGGKIALLDNDRLFVTVGEIQDEMMTLARDDSVSYGKIHEVSRTNGTSRIFSRGHRAPQGLLASHGEIWSAEHGPQGGDELNLIRENGDYGWPATTYGTAYGQKSWPLSNTPGEHSVGILPTFAWVPSVAVTELLRVSGSSFSFWKDDFLVGALNNHNDGYALFRVKVREGSTRLVEPIKTGRKIRSMLEMPGGELVFWDGIDTLQILRPVSDPATAAGSTLE
jgi:glucose/arabinose dehydrogenase